MFEAKPLDTQESEESLHTQQPTLPKYRQRYYLVSVQFLNSLFGQVYFSNKTLDAALKHVKGDVSQICDWTRAQ